MPDLISEAKLIFKNQSVNIRELYKRKDGTYFVRVTNYDFESKSYNSPFDINYGLYSEAWACVNFQDTPRKV